MRPTIGEYAPSEFPSFLGILRSFALAPMAIVVCTTAIPGFLFCVPALILAAVFVAIPIVVLGLLASIAAALVALPVLAVRGLRRLPRPHRAPAEDRPPAPVPAPTVVPALAGLRTSSARRP